MPPVMEQQNRRVILRNALTAGESDVIKAEAEAQQEQAAGAEREIFFDHVSEARPDLVDELPKWTMLKGYRNRPFSRMKRWKFAATGSPSAEVDLTLDANQLKPIAYGESQQPTGEMLGLSQIEIFAKSTLKKATLDALVEQYGLRIHYHDGRPALEMPLGDVLRVKVVSPDAGTAASNDAVVAGTYTVVNGVQGAIDLEGRDRLIVPPGDGQTRLELFRYPEYTSAPTLSGETADLYLYVIFRGWRYANAKGKA